VSSNIAISVRNVSKKYRLFDSNMDRVKEALSPSRHIYHREFWALHDINLEIPKGSTLGVMGHNGAGKTTLLRLLAGIQHPTDGEITVDGRVQILELGTGFNPELSGRENVRMQAQIQGQSASEIDDRMAQVEAFAEIGEFIDHPIKTYSSGMYMRLAFAAAISVDPDILIVDEAMAVGDAKFQRKCYRQFEDYQTAGKTIILVSHSSDAIVNHCDTAMLLSGGRLIMHDTPRKIADEYHSLLFGRTSPAGGVDDIGAGSTDRDVEGDSTDEIIENFLLATGTDDVCHRRRSYNPNESRNGLGGTVIFDYLVITPEGADQTRIQDGSRMDIYMKIKYMRDVEMPTYGMMLKTVEGVMVYGNGTELMRMKHPPAVEGETRIVHFNMDMNIRSGDYFISLGSGDIRGPEVGIMDTRFDLAHIHVDSDCYFDGIADLAMSMDVTSGRQKN
jgi:lipopolysaccharide transport system ATP-binding protein